MMFIKITVKITCRSCGIVTCKSHVGIHVLYEKLIKINSIYISCRSNLRLKFLCGSFRAFYALDIVMFLGLRIKVRMCLTTHLYASVRIGVPFARMRTGNACVRKTHAKKARSKRTCALKWGVTTRKFNRSGYNKKQNAKRNKTQKLNSNAGSSSCTKKISRSATIT